MSAFFKKIAPWLAAGANAAVPGLGTAVAGIVASVTGKEVKPDASSISTAVESLAGNAEALAKLKAADQQFQEQMQKLGFDHEEDLEKIAAADRDSARNREIQVRDDTPRILAYLYAAGFFSTLAAEIWMAVSGVSVNPLASKSIDILLGVLTGMVLGTKEYYFGSSAGSARKTELLAASQPPDS